MNEWLDTIIMDLAATHGVNAQTADRTNDRDDLSRIQLRLDDLSRRIEQVACTNPAAYTAKRSYQMSEQIADQERPEHHFRETAQESQSQILDRAIAEFAQRQRALDDNIPTRPPATALDLTGLEDQLRRITDQIESLKRPDIEDAIRSLHAELGEIGRALNEALPRHAIELLEMQIQVLTQRIAEGREAGADREAIAGIESGLAQVRDALRGLMPAEHLVDYNEAIRTLTEKIDLIVADKNPATMQQLERSLATLREMSAHVASNDTVSRLSAQVQTLTEKIDRLAVGATTGTNLGDLERRIETLTRALAERAQTETAVPRHLESLIQALSVKIEQLQKSGSGNFSVNHLEDRIVKLMERLDASDSRLNKLDAIERGLADLLVHIEELRAGRKSAATQLEGSGIDILRQDIAHTKKSVEAVHRRLSDFFERTAPVNSSSALEPKKTVISIGENFDFAAPPVPAPIEQDYAAPIAEKAGPPDTRTLATSTQTSVPVPAELPLENRIPPPAPVISTPPDQLLEPGSGPPRRAISPSLRIAASEAALGGMQSNAAPTSKSDFIAAARRAAQAAQEQARASRSEVRQSVDRAETGQTRVAKRAKSALLAASIAAVIIGSLQLAGNVFDFSIFDVIENKFVGNLDSNAVSSDSDEIDSTTVAAIPNEEPATAGVKDPAPPAEPPTADAIASLLSPQVSPLMPAPGTTIPLGSNMNQSLLTPPGAGEGTALASIPSVDITGTVTHGPATSPKRQSAAPQQVTTAERLPANIGSSKLRNAAIGGDASAAYEVAMRYVEGRGVPANLEEAARWFERAASKGLTPAQFRYASMLEKGQGVKKDLVAAQKLYIAAASKGHAKAMHNLAVLYAEGIDGKPDYTSAAQWFRKAAEHGVADSQYNLGILTARGLGTDRNLAESYKWFALAASQGDKEAVRKRDEIASHLDAQALASAQQVVKAFEPAKQPAEAITIAAPPGGWDRTT
ncbi:MAG TPA: hypothetical protein VH558_10795 [Pseudolabrys sp.]